MWRKLGERLPRARSLQEEEEEEKERGIRSGQRLAGARRLARRIARKRIEGIKRIGLEGGF